MPCPTSRLAIAQWWRDRVAKTIPEDPIHDAPGDLDESEVLLEIPLPDTSELGAHLSAAQQCEDLIRRICP